MKIAFIIKGLIKNKFRLTEEIMDPFPAAEIFETKQAFHAVELAKNAVENNFTHIIAVGGDGTLSEVVNGMALSGKENLPVLGLLSYGTANDFSKTTKLYGSISQLKNLIENNSTRKIDIGNVKFTGKNQMPEERYFINIGDIPMQ